jgi:two-component system, OmpR family, phosphate regulon sensor histidine kinase PhoR
MTLFQNNNKGKEKSSISRRILLPFMLITVFLAFFSMMLSIHFISQTMDTRLIKELETQTLLMNGNLQSRLKKLVFHTQMITDVRRYLSDIKSSRKVEVGEALATDILRKTGTNIYWGLDKLPKEKVALYEKLIQAGELGLSRRNIFIDKKSKVTAAAISITKHKGLYKPVITEICFDNSLLTEVQGKNDESEIAFIHSKKSNNNNNIFASTQLVSGDAILKVKLLEIISKEKPLRNQKIYKTITSNNIAYKIVLEKWDYHKDIYYTVITPYSSLLDTKIRIVIGTIILLTLICLWILVIYSVIIKNITSSINDVAEFAGEIAKGNLHKQIFISNTPKEIDQLTNSLNMMVTNLKKSSSNLITEKNRLDAIIAGIPDGIILTDMDNKLIKANRQAEKMFNFSSNKSQGKDLLKYINNENILLALKQGLKVGHKKITRELQLPVENEKNVTYALSSGFVTNDLSYKIGVVTVIRDITHQKELNELREGFLRTVSHELRTPLTSIIGFLNVLNNMTDDALSDQQRYFIEIISKESNNLHEIINDLLDLSRIRAGKMEMNIEPVNINELYKELLASFMPMAKSKSLKLISELNKKTTVIDADRSKLRRIFVNLISNAIKFTEKGGITLFIEDKAKEIVFAIKDTGLGLKDHEQDLVFEKFRQVDYSEHRKYEGLGIGLSIVKQLVILHKGKIWVESKYHEGSTFYFSIPKNLK